MNRYRVWFFGVSGRDNEIVLAEHIVQAQMIIAARYGLAWGISAELIRGGCDA